jgi:hypothetical protein
VNKSWHGPSFLVFFGGGRVFYLLGLARTGASLVSRR